MTENKLNSEELGTLLHTVFDEQIINYGAYNLVLARGSAIYRNPDIAAHQHPDQDYFLIGYRDVPREVVLTPFALPNITSMGSPTSIDNTNAIRAYVLNENTFGIESTNGSSFIVKLTPLMELTTSHGSGVLDQSTDLEDFVRFLEDSWLEEN